MTRPKLIHIVSAVYPLWSSQLHENFVQFTTSRREA